MINFKSVNTKEADSFEDMVKEMEEKQFPWPYLQEETQEVAKAYGAHRAPHFYAFDESRKLICTGRAVDCLREPEKVTEKDLEQTYQKKGG